MRKSKLQRLMEQPGALIKLQQQMLAPLQRELLYDGRVRELFESLSVPCIKCKTVKSKHGRRFKHPWFKDNLAYLEWKYDQTS